MSTLTIKTGTIATLCLASVILTPAKVWAVNAKAQELLLKGYSECQSALLLRRKDLSKAKSAYKNYQSLKSQAIAIDLKVLESKAPEVERVITYCNAVGADISRTEALPIIAKGTEACGEAANHLRNNEFDRAKKAYSRYLQYKDEAVSTSDVILEVFSVKTEVRRCERIAQDIEVAYRRSKETKQQLQQSLAYLKKTLGICQSLAIDDQPLDKRHISQLKQDIGKVRARDKDTPNRSLLESNRSLSPEQTKKVAGLKKEIKACIASNQLAADTKEQQLIAMIKAEEERQQKALEEKKTAEHLAKPQETEEQRVVRLSDNFKYYRLVNKVVPKYPDSISYNRVGYVVVEYNIDTDGVVVDPKVISAMPEHIFDKAALETIKKWKYSAEFGDAKPDIALARTRIRFAP